MYIAITIVLIVLVCVGCNSNSYLNEDIDEEKQNQDTNYIEESRKNAYMDTARAYIKGTIVEINRGVKYRFYDTDIT